MKEKVKVQIDLELDIVVKTVVRNAVEQVEPANETLVAKIAEEAEKAERKRVAKNKSNRNWYKNTVEGKIRKAAENAVYRATRKGELIRPDICPNCGKGSHEPIHGHHESYLPEHWLDVDWLCKSCHQNLHINKQKNGGNHVQENKSCSIFRA